ncbi:uncharacterized protein L201_006377 [Kwoniella dendrophila CBS 6074]|uniref:Uncharacterized protein n=1 Tax=Kwoniella dendrophila CBS 6074 TaxID=1295534 RepID=A0AAX4K1H7_9TREE
MTPNAKESSQCFKLPPGKIAVVVGGTTPVGVSITRRLASLGCSRVITIGKYEKQGNEKLEDIKETYQGQVVLEFVEEDLSCVKGIKDAFSSFQQAWGDDKVDYLIMSQSGPPTGIINLNEDGEGTEFTIQVISRFLLAYLFIKEQLLRSEAGVMFIGNPGLNYDLDVEDLSLKKVAEGGRYKPLIALDQTSRDSTVLDSITLEFSSRYPQYNFYHVLQGLVKTSLFNIPNLPFPFPLNYLAGIGLIGSPITSDEVADIPLYLLVHPEAKEQLGNGLFWNYKLQSESPGAWASDAGNRGKLWDKLCGMIVEGGQSAP